MEKCVDSNYMQSEHDASKTSDTKTCIKCYFSNNKKEKNKCKACYKVSRTRKKIASEEWSRGQSDPDKVKSKKSRGHFVESNIDVLNKHVTETTTATSQSVQKKTKILKRNVPDRLGKYVSSSVRSETKLFLGDCKLETKSSSKERSDESSAVSSGEHSKLKISLDGYTETKLSMLGNECLSNKEAVSLRNSFESDLDTKNIFENFFDDCLDSTSKGKDVSSQELNIETNSESLKIGSDTVGKYNSLLESLESFEKSNGGMQVEKTPVKKKQEIAPSAPVKIKDHSGYYSSHKNIRHVCAYCQKIFKSNGKLNSHVYSHTGEKPFDCNHCGKAFSSKFKLVRHLLIHSEIRKFVCQICDRTFLRNDHLKNHYKVHDPQKKMYKCPKENCDKEYSSIMSHKKHMAYHNVEDGDLKCLICNVKFETKEEILYHLKSHSGSRLFKSQSDKKFKCEFCGRLFLTRKDVTRHLVVHTGERDFLCQFCPQRFGRKDHLVRHIKKSHGNEDLPVKSEPDKPPKEEIKKLEESDKVKKQPIKDDSTRVGPSRTENPSDEIPALVLSNDSTTKENNTQTEEVSNKTHIVITVQGKSVKNGLQNRKRKLHDKKKSFQKNESLVPKKKQVPLSKGKNSTTQILLQNIPNILIIPNNSIILLRNQSGSSKIEKGDEEENARTEGEPAIREGDCEGAKPAESLLEPPPIVQNSNDGGGNFSSNFNYDSGPLQPPSHFLEGFTDSDNFNFQTDFSSFTSQFEESEHLNFEMLNNTDLLPRPEVGLNSLDCPTRSESLANGSLLTETSRQIKLLETGINTISKDKTGNDLFEDGNESLMLNEFILNDFKEESSAVLPTDADVGVLSNLLNQPNDNCGFELLRNLLTNENPTLSPLPGFSQIFHNSNTNSS